MDTNSPSSSSSSTHQWKYHVFLSFRGEDTRNNFTDHLYAALNQKGIYTFRDDEKLERGRHISELFKAIEDSLFTIVVLSKNYASSTWCLDELVKIMECKKKIGQIVLPIFYDVEPSVVRKQTGTYAEAFVEHEKPFNKNLEKVHAWRAALTDVTNLAGWSLGDRPEVEFIQGIIKVISLKLCSLFPEDINGLVGINSRLEELMLHLAMGSNDVRIIGIWGMGGIGKTTLARVVYDKVVDEFEGGCFIANVRSESESEKCGLLKLQQKLIHDILMGESVNIRDDKDGVSKIKNRLCHRKILLVLDDVNQSEQLEKLAGDSKWFGLGSRVIITTRDESLLTRREVHEKYEVREMYVAHELTNWEAFELFSLKAFGKYYPPEDYLDLSTFFVDYARGLPLAICVLGSFLYNRGKKEWEATLDKIKEYPEKDIFKILEIGFDGLGDAEKEIFLHIACFFNMKEKDYIVEVLDCLRLYPNIGLKVLIERSLLKQSGNAYQMHDLLQKMGQNIVRRDYPQEPGKWSKLWLYEDIRNVLLKNKEMEAIRGLVLELDGLRKLEKAHLNLEALSRMPNLQLLIIHGVQVLHGCKHLSNNLRLLDWEGYPSRSLPLDFELGELGGLNLLDSKIVRLWKDTKYLDKLKFIKLNNSLNLIAAPDFTEVPNLEKLVFNGCISLHEVHPSLMVLKRLTLLDLENCKSLRSLPNKFEMESLEILILSGCSKIKRIPEFMENMKRLSKLHLNGTAITELPFSIGHLTNLISLNLRDCNNLVCLPSVICSFKSLKYFDLAGCLKLDSLPENLGNVESLEELDVSGISFRELPASVVNLKDLKKLSFRGCNWPTRNLNLLMPSLFGMCSLKRLDLSDCSLQIIPNDIGNLSSLSHLDLSENLFSFLPDCIVQLSNLLELDLHNCTKLRSLSQLPSRINLVRADGCASLEAFPIAPEFAFCDNNRSTQFYYFNFSKWAGSHGQFDMFLERMMLPILQDVGTRSAKFNSINLLFPGSEVLEFCDHQSAGNMVKAQVTHPNRKVNIQVPSHSRNKWTGITLCVVCSDSNFHLSCAPICLQCDIVINKVRDNHPFKALYPRLVKNKSSFVLMSFVPYQWLIVHNKALCNPLDEDVFIDMEVSFRWTCGQGPVFEKCGFRIVYEQDLEEGNEMVLALCNKSGCIIPYEDLDVHHDLDVHRDGIREMMTQSSNSSCIVPYMRNAIIVLCMACIIPYLVIILTMV